MRRALQTLEESVRNVENLAPAYVLREEDKTFEGDRVFLDLVKKTTAFLSRKRKRSARSTLFVRFTTQKTLVEEQLKDVEKDVFVVDANEFVFERRSGFDFGFEKEEENENALERLLGKLGEILNADAHETKREEEEAKPLSPRRTTTGELGTDADATRNDKSNNNNIPRSGIFGYASKDSEHQTVVFLDDISCVSFIYGEQSVVRFVRAVQRMSRARGVVVRERVFSSSSTTTATNGGGNERSSMSRSRRRRSGRSAASDVLANDASCSCAMTLSRQSNGRIRSNGGSGRKTLFTAEAKRGATRKTRETDVVQFVKVPSSSSSGNTTTQCIALEYTSIDDALRNEKDIQKARERSRTEKLTDKLNKFSTFNLGINATNGGNQRERDAKRNVKLAYQHEGGTPANDNTTATASRTAATAETFATFRQTLPRDAGGLLGRAGQGHGEKIKNLLEYERDETDEHDYGSGVDTDEEIDDLDDF
ncbi:unnamed protein product [Bathycoccus prasinos]|jgi:hypothetical protein